MGVLVDGKVGTHSRRTETEKDERVSFKKLSLFNLTVLYSGICFCSFFFFLFLGVSLFVKKR